MHRVCIIELKRISPCTYNVHLTTVSILCIFASPVQSVQTQKLIHNASKKGDNWWSKRPRHSGWWLRRTVVVAQSYPTTCNFWACSIIRGSASPAHHTPHHQWSVQLPNCGWLAADFCCCCCCRPKKAPLFVNNLKQALQLWAMQLPLILLLTPCQARDSQLENSS